MAMLAMECFLLWGELMRVADTFRLPEVGGLDPDLLEGAHGAAAPLLLQLRDLPDLLAVHLLHHLAALLEPLPLLQ